MKLNAATAHGFRQLEYNRLKTYLKNHAMIQAPKQVAIERPPQACEHNFTQKGVFKKTVICSKCGEKR